MHTDRIVAFYSGEPDDQGRTLDEILRWSDHSLEDTHDYIQWLFPTPMPSAVNPTAPLVTPKTAAAFATRPELRQRLARALDRMLAFYGLRHDTGPYNGLRIVIDAPRWPARAAEWLRPHNHNHLRLTRIMQSLAALGLREEAKALQRCLVADVCEGPGAGKVTRETREFWLSAC
jgi:Opioid growth factor receptor (OGFr) conserved region